MSRSWFAFTLPPPLRRGLRLRQLQLAVIVAVVAVRMMQVAVHEIIDVIAVRDRFVAATGAVDMRGVVAGAGRGVAVGIRGADFDDVLIDMPRVRMMQMPVVQVIDVPVVLHRSVAAVGAVLVVVVGMNVAGAHSGGGLLLGEASPSAPFGQGGIHPATFA